MKVRIVVFCAPATGTPPLLSQATVSCVYHEALDSYALKEREPESLIRVYTIPRPLHFNQEELCRIVNHQIWEPPKSALPKIHQHVFEDLHEDIGRQMLYCRKIIVD